MRDDNLGELISGLYAQYLLMFGNAELASVATAATVNDMLENDTGCSEPLASGGSTGWSGVYGQVVCNDT